MTPSKKMQSNSCPWVLVHIITKLEIGGAQFATLDTLEKSAIPFKERILLCGPGGDLDQIARDLSNTETVFISSLQNTINPLQDCFALFKIYLSFELIPIYLGGLFGIYLP